MIPDRVPSGSSQAERRIFQELHELEVPEWTVALHSLNLPEHVRKRVCEIDFLLVGERGLLALEVKGGVVSCRKGIWHSRDLRGRRHRLKESPLEQASTAMFSLENRLRNHFGAELPGRTVFAHGVVLPDCDFDVASAEWDPAMVMDAHQIATTGWKAWLDALGTFWEEKPGSRARLSAADVKRYLEFLRPDFDQIPTLRQLSQQVEADLTALTQQQYRALDLGRSNDRIIFEGGAGTGKTMLAAEICRRSADSGVRVLMTCRSGVLATFVGDQPGLEKATVVPFHRVAEFDAASFDLVVVDEAQDLINTADLEVIDRVLAGGLADGRWVFLLDSNNQRGLVGHYEAEAMASLNRQRPAKLVLVDNCRNTSEIVTATQQRTGADLGVTTAGHGLEVSVLEPPVNEAGRAIGEVLDQLVDDQVPLEHVVLLSARDFAESVFGSLPPVWRQRVDLLDLIRLRSPTPGRIGFADIARFKGLESPFVLLESPPPVDTDAARTELYVGMTRARAALWVVSPISPVWQDQA
ncbi:NERD domain-containing protein [Saccharopolyspora shandongensis]|uniref:nuclease-related domain-containing DEAD/DEAH box helicase n=1 Tax=Saccharopolyspora shandongensis TaxID=418495 RepID=UPI0034456AC8